MNLKRATIEFDGKAVRDDGTFTGYASKFGVIDSYRDIVAPGAFKSSLEARPAHRVKMLWQHDASQPIGVWDTMGEDKQGLVATGRLALDTVKGREAYSLMKMGAVDGLSIGFITKTEEMDRQSGIRTLKSVNLMEVSLVTFPANAEATITNVKGSDMTEREFERALRDAGFSVSEAKTIVAHGFKALKRERDAAGGDQAAGELLAAIQRAEQALRI